MIEEFQLLFCAPEEIAHFTRRANNSMTLDLVLVHVELDFKSPIKIHDNIHCETAIYQFGVKSFKMVQRLICAETGQVKSICHSVLAGFDREKETSLPIKDTYRTAISEFERVKF